MYTIDELFENSAPFHDVVLEATGKSLDKEALKEIFKKLPGHIQATALEWGLSDTVFRDNAYTELMREC